MQRKLSAIAEIPKILSSTLATVSQSFGTEAVYKRKCSYDEDALDYELLEQPESEGDEDVDEEETEEEEEDDLVQVQDDDANDLAVKQYKSKALKDATPESDYASEANYATNETSDEDDDADEIYYIKLPVMPAGGDFNEAATADAVNISSEDDDDDDDDDDVNVDEADNKSDFLSTTYTWNLRNVPKLSINDAEGVCNLTLSPQQELELEQHNAIDTSKVRAATPTPMSTRVSTAQLSLEAPPTTTTTTTTADAQSQKLLFKLDNLERSWPWADREKIIYKQSTCHLVSRKPLGFVGQRIQLLANQELLRKDKDKAQ